MRKLAVLLVASVAAVSGANAAAVISVGSTSYGLAAPAGAGALVDFDSNYAGFTLAGSGYVVQSGNNSLGAAPADGATNDKDDATNYLSVYGGRATLTGSQAYNSVSLYWGSIDQYNALDLLDAAGATIATIDYTTIAAGSNGDQLSGNTNRRVNISSSQAFNGLAFRSTSAAFEADNVKFSGAVPEPTTWAMMVGGFGLIGGAMRSSRRKSAVSFA